MKESAGHLTENEPGKPAVGDSPRFSRLLLEGLVIVVSVLIALAGDAWWAGVQEKKTGQTYVGQLTVDLAKMDQEVSEWLAVEEAHLANTVRLLEYVDGNGDGPPRDSLQTWWRGSWTGLSREFADGTLRDLIGAGALRSIQDDSLRTLLSSFVRRVDDTQARLAQIESNFSLLLADPYFQSHMGLWGMYSESTKAVRGIPSGERFAIDFERIRHDREFANIIMRGYVYKLNRVGELRSLKTATERLRARLESAGR